MKNVLIILLLVLTLNVNSATTTARTHIFVTSYEDSNYNLRICNHLDGCNITTPDTNIFLNVTKDYTVEIIPVIYNLTKTKTYVDITTSKVSPILFLIALGCFMVVAIKFAMKFSGGNYAS